MAQDVEENDNDGCYEEEDGEEEPIEDDAYLEPESDTYECLQDADLGIKLGFTPRKQDAHAATVNSPEPLPPKAPKPSEVPTQLPPGGMVSSYLENSYLSSHLSPVKPRPTDSPIQPRFVQASESPGSPVRAVVPPPQPNKAEPMEAAAADCRAERLARIALLKYSDRIGIGFIDFVSIPPKQWPTHTI